MENVILTHMKPIFLLTFILNAFWVTTITLEWSSGEYDICYYAYAKPVVQ